MPKLSPEAKKVLSAALVAAAFALVSALQLSTHLLPPLIAPFVASVLAGIAHYLDALGHKERRDKEVAAKVEEIVESEQ